MPERFDMRSGPNGSWTVVDLTTEMPATLKTRPLIDLDRDEADDLVVELNALVRRSGPDRTATPRPAPANDGRRLSARSPL